MGFWPFKRDDGEVEVAFATRVVTALTALGVKLRGKLTVHFAEPQVREVADTAADACAFAASQLLSEAADHRRLLGAEEAIVAKLRKRLPDGTPELRAIELVSLHVVGEMPPGPRRPSLRAMRAADVKGDAVAPPPMRRPVDPGPARRQLGRPRSLPPKTAEPEPRKPAVAVDLKTPPSGRTPPVRKASVKVSLPRAPPSVPEPPRAPPVPSQPPRPKRRPSAEIPRVEPAAAKPVVRRSPPPNPRVASPVPPPPPREPPSRRSPPSGRRPPTPVPVAPRSGSPKPAKPAASGPAMWPRRSLTYRKALERIPEGASAGEIAGPVALVLRDIAARLYLTAAIASDHENLDLMEAFESAAGDAIASDTRIAMERLRRESSACAAYLFYAALLQIGIPQNIAIETLQAAWMGSLPGRMPIAELTRYLSAKQTAREFSFAAVLILSSDQDPAEVRVAIEPLLDVLGPEVEFAANVVKRATGL